MLKLKRVYDEPSATDGLRILVERLWPRGLTKEKAKVDLWLKDVSPSPELRTWYGHEPERWSEFRKRYEAELKNLGDLLVLLKWIAGARDVSFVYAASDEERNSATVLKEFLEE